MHLDFRPIVAGLLLANLLPLAKADPAPRPAEALRARNEACAALSAGDTTRAMTSLRGAASRGPLAPAEDAQVITALCSLAREMEAKAPGRGRVAASLAVSEARRSRAKLGAREAAITDLALGELSEHLLGDHENARGHYESALASGATAAAARRALDRLAWRRDLIESKSAGAASLRRRNS